MQRLRITAGHALVVVSVAAGTGVFALAGCGDTQDVLDAEDRNDFVNASNKLVAAHRELASKTETISNQQEIPAFVALANEMIVTMQEQAAELERLASNVDGEPNEIAEDAAAAAQAVIAGTQKLVAALEATDMAALEAAIAESDAAIEAFNAEITAWNDLADE